MSKDEALKLALEALERYQIKRQDFDTFTDVITAIKEALAKDEKGLFIDLIAQHEGLAEELAQDDQSSSQEPVAIYRAGQAKGEGFHVEFLKEMGDDEVLLYTTPPKEQQSCDKRPWGKPWVSLTAGEIYKSAQKSGVLMRGVTSDDALDLAQAIEAKLKEKNT